ncbi:MAG: J domain-containing protein [Pseudomonadota bacterium]
MEVLPVLEVRPEKVRWRSNRQGRRQVHKPGRVCLRRVAGKPKKSPHEILEVPLSATPQEIWKAFRAKANQYHPDQVQHLGEEFRVLAEERFKDIQQAYRELTAQEI